MISLNKGDIREREREKEKGKKNQGGAVRQSGVARNTRKESQPYKPQVSNNSGEIFGLAQSGSQGNVSVPRGRGTSSLITKTGGSIIDRLGEKKPLGGTKLTVQNLPKDVTQEEIMDLFREIGEVYSAKKFSNNKGEVVMAQQSKALEAIKTYHGRDLDGIPLVVKFASRPGMENPANTHLEQANEANSKAEAFFGGGSSFQHNSNPNPIKNRGVGQLNKNTQKVQQKAVMTPPSAPSFFNPQQASKMTSGNTQFSITLGTSNQNNQQQSQAQEKTKGKGQNKNKNNKPGKGAQKNTGKGKGGKGNAKPKPSASDLDADMDAYFSAQQQDAV
mmetsp:Transcript_47336/g.60799  ORF Transcript_47336/g.60799 Transcript_47336/m.60799 type:complete len:332 (+) Transcript_47336:75-1070(+)